MTISKKRLDNSVRSVCIHNRLNNYKMTHRFDKLSVVGNIQSHLLDDFYNRVNNLKSNRCYIIKKGKPKDKNIKELYCYQISIRSRRNKKQILVINYMPTKTDFKESAEYKGRGG